MTSFGTLWRTIRHLRLIQITARLKLRAVHPRLDRRPAPAVRQQAADWVTASDREPMLLGRWRFRFLNQVRDLDAIGWDDPTVEKLWRYNLHYFDDLNASHSDARLEDHHRLVQRWIDENPPGRGTAWEPYPTSLRIVNWIKWMIRTRQRPESYLNSLAVQARWLERRLEFHLLGNHLLSNAKALLFAGWFFDGPEAQRWLDEGCSILKSQLREQILPDGGHFERSPMYHALILEDMLDLLNLLRVYDRCDDGLVPLLQVTASRMLGWIRVMCHPDGTYANFNDSAQGIALRLDQLEIYCAQMGIAAPNSGRLNDIHLADSGYVRLQRGSAVVLIDVAPVGPDYLPGHAHADTLSFELSLFGSRVVVNGGTSCYGQSAQRMKERSTERHSTVELAGKNSSEVWGGFRVGRRARPFDLTVAPAEVACSHDGYRHMRGQPIHRRTWRLREQALIIDDEVSVAMYGGVARYLLAPGLRARNLERNAWSIEQTVSAKAVARVHVEQGRASVEPSEHASSFGITQAVECLAVHLSEGRATTVWEWGADARESET